MEQGVDLQRSQRAGDSGTGEAKGQRQDRAESARDGKGRHNQKIKPHSKRLH
jgi:hypothetical protein